MQLLQKIISNTILINMILSEVTCNIIVLSSIIKKKPTLKRKKKRKTIGHLSKFNLMRLYNCYINVKHTTIKSS